MEVIKIDQISVEVVRKKIKHMNLTVSPPHGNVRISAPRFISLRNIEQFVQSKLSWIEKNRNKIQSRPRTKKLEYKNGEELSFFGKFYKLIVVENALIDQIDIEDESIHAFLAGNPTIEQRQKIFQRWYADQLTKPVQELIESWKEKVGATISRWRIRNMSTRWGSYSSRTKIISVNVELAKKPLPCLEYLIVHELAHVFVPGHGKKFKQFMDKYLPDWRDRRKVLNQK